MIAGHRSELSTKLFLLSETSYMQTGFPHSNYFVSDVHQFFCWQLSPIFSKHMADSKPDDSFLAFLYLGYVFFNKGLTREVLKDLGTLAVSIERLMIFVNIGRSSILHSFRSQVGIGSSSQDLFGDFIMTFSTSSSVVGRKCVKIPVSVIWLFSSVCFEF